MYMNAAAYKTYGAATESATPNDAAPATTRGTRPSGSSLPVGGGVGGGYERIDVDNAATRQHQRASSTLATGTGLGESSGFAGFNGGGGVAAGSGSARVLVIGDSGVGKTVLSRYLAAVGVSGLPAPTTSTVGFSVEVVLLPPSNLFHRQRQQVDESADTSRRGSHHHHHTHHLGSSPVLPAPSDRIVELVEVGGNRSMMCFAARCALYHRLTTSSQMATPSAASSSSQPPSSPASGFATRVQPTNPHPIHGVIFVYSADCDDSVLGMYRWYQELLSSGVIVGPPAPLTTSCAGNNNNLDIVSGIPAMPQTQDQRDARQTTATTRRGVPFTVVATSMERAKRREAMDAGLLSPSTTAATAAATGGAGMHSYLSASSSSMSNTSSSRLSTWSSVERLFTRANVCVYVACVRASSAFCRFLETPLGMVLFALWERWRGLILLLMSFALFGFGQNLVPLQHVTPKSALAAMEAHANCVSTIAACDLSSMDDFLETSGSELRHFLSLAADSVGGEIPALVTQERVTPSAAQQPQQHQQQQQQFALSPVRSGGGYKRD